MKKLLFLIGFLFASNVHAETLPEGCYIPNSQREIYAESAERGIAMGIIPCWIPSDGRVDYGVNPVDILSPYQTAYGKVVGTLIFNSIQTQDTLKDCADLFENTDAQNKDLSSQNSSLTNQNSNLIAIYNALSTSYNAQLALVKKLRKKCGLPCKKVK